VPHKHLSAEERLFIEVFLAQNKSVREIASALNRSHTSISRELWRNSTLSGYRAVTAQKRAESRRKQPRHFRRQQHAPLVAYVDRKLRRDWSPEQIVNRMYRDYPDDSRMDQYRGSIFMGLYSSQPRQHYPQALAKRPQSTPTAEALRARKALLSWAREHCRPASRG